MKAIAGFLVFSFFCAGLSAPAFAFGVYRETCHFAFGQYRHVVFVVEQVKPDSIFDFSFTLGLKRFLAKPFQQHPPRRLHFNYGTGGAYSMLPLIEVADLETSHIAVVDYFKGFVLIKGFGIPEMDLAVFRNGAGARLGAAITFRNGRKFLKNLSFKCHPE